MTKKKEWADRQAFLTRLDEAKKLADTIVTMAPKDKNNFDPWELMVYTEAVFDLEPVLDRFIEWLESLSTKDHPSWKHARAGVQGLKDMYEEWKKGAAPIIKALKEAGEYPTLQ